MTFSPARIIALIFNLGAQVGTIPFDTASIDLFSKLTKNVLVGAWASAKIFGSRILRNIEEHSTTQRGGGGGGGGGVVASDTGPVGFIGFTGATASVR